MRTMNAQARATMSKRKNFVNYATMTLSDGTVLNLKPSDFRISGNSFTDDFVDSDDFAIGTTLGKTCTIVLDNTDNRTEVVDGNTVTYKTGKFSNYDFYMAYFYLYVHLPDAWVDASGDTQDGIIEIGKFTVTSPVSTGTTIEITGVDEMYKFDKSFDSFGWSSNQTLYSILTSCCNDCGVAIDFDNTFDNASYVVTCDKPEGITYRQMVSYVLQIAGYNARISKTGALQLIWYDMTAFGNDVDGGTFSKPHLGPGDTWGDGAELDGGSFNPWTVGDVYEAGLFSSGRKYHILNSLKGLTISTDEIKFTGVKVVNQEDEIESLYGTEDYAISITDNVLTNNKTQAELNTIATHIYSKVNSVIIRPYSCQILQNPIIEPGDCVLLWDVKGNAFKSVVTNVAYTTGGYTTISCKAKSPTVQKSTFVNSSAQAVVEARRNTQKQIDTYNNTVQHFNELANNSLGYYTTTAVESGATVTYIHDQPTLSSSTIIWKQTATGWFISQDGGASYTAGVDASTATMLMNLIYVHGLNADWINAGSIFLSGQENGMTFNAYNYFYVYDHYNVSGTANTTLYKFLNEYKPIVEVHSMTSSTMTATIRKSGTVLETMTLSLGDNQFTTTVPIVSSGDTNYYDIVITGTGVVSVKCYHYAVDIRPNTYNKSISNIPMCDMYCYDLYAERIKSGYIKSTGAVSGNTISATSSISSSGSISATGSISTDGSISASGSIVTTEGGNIGKHTFGDSGAFLKDDDDHICSVSDGFRWNGIVHFSASTAYYKSKEIATTGSDRRMKKSIVELSKDKIRNLFSELNFVKFKYRKEFNETEDDYEHYGVIAQDMIDTFNEVGLDSRPFISETEISSGEGDNMLAVKYGEFIALQGRAIQDLYEIVENQQKEINTLKEKLGV